MKINYLFIAFLLTVLTGTLQAQPYMTVKDMKGKQQKQYERIQEYNQQQSFERALEALDDLLADVPSFIDGYLLRARIHYDLGQLESAEADLEKVITLDASYDAMALYQLALTEKRLAKYDEAVTHLEQFLASHDRRQSVVERATAHLADARFAADAVSRPVAFEPENLGAPISSADPEYLPVLSADGQSMIFTRRIRQQEDFFIATKNGETWTEAVPLTALNTPFNEGAHSISADGRLLVFTMCRSGADQGGCDLFFSEKCEDKWSAPQPLPRQVNTGAWEAQPSLSADGSLLLFASDRPGGYGGRDIWGSRRRSDGSWSDAVNLGEAINTRGNDQCPFLHADGQTLYYCSDGRPGMGGNDLYYVRLQADGQWSEVQNLGYPINTPDNEGTLTISLDGRTAYFAKSPATSANDLDIFTFPLYAAARPQPVTYVAGRVTDAVSGQPLRARAELVDIDSGRPVAIVSTCDDGSYLVCLPAGKNYALSISKPDYLFFSEHFALVDSVRLDEPYQLDAALQPLIDDPATDIPASKPVVLKNVFFATASADLLPSSTAELNRLVSLLDQHPMLSIQINGHTDNVGSEEDNLKLSEARALAVYNYLVKAGGIDPDRLRYAGFGESRPIAENDTPEGRQQNRRTEFEIWKK